MNKLTKEQATLVADIERLTSLKLATRPGKRRYFTVDAPEEKMVDWVMRPIWLRRLIAACQGSGWVVESGGYAAVAIVKMDRPQF